jgi:hypothetical protein
VASFNVHGSREPRTPWGTWTEGGAHKIGAAVAPSSYQHQYHLLQLRATGCKVSETAVDPEARDAVLLARLRLDEDGKATLD